MKRREQVAIAAMGYCPPAATAARASPRRQYLFFLLRAERGLAGPSPIRRLAASVRHCGRVNLDLPGCRSETEAAALRRQWRTPARQSRSGGQQWAPMPNAVPWGGILSAPYAARLRLVTRFLPVTPVAALEDKS